MSEKTHVMIIGAGIMGAGIFNSFFLCQGAFKISIVESIEKQLLALKLPPTIDTYSSIGQCKIEPDIIIEAVPEKMDLKLQVYQEIEKVFSDKVIIATNTSTLPVQQMADHLKSPQRFLGCHYNHPAHINPIVEVTRIKQSLEEHVQSLLGALKQCGKIPVVFTKPVDGFITNRLQHALYREAYSLIEQGYATPQDIDIVAKHMFGPRMSVTGLLQQKDVSGLDTHYLAHREVIKSLSNTTVCNPVLEAKYGKGEFGLKSGQGWYDWKKDGKDANTHKKEIEDKLQQVYNFLKENDIPL